MASEFSLCVASQSDLHHLRKQLLMKKLFMLSLSCLQDIRILLHVGRQI